MDHFLLKHARLARQIFDVGLRGRLRTLLLLYICSLWATTSA